MIPSDRSRAKRKGGAIVLSEIFPPTKGGSGKWLSEIYSRMPGRSCVMVVGDAHCGADSYFCDEEYPQLVFRENLAMAFRGVSKFASLRDYHRIFRTVCQLAKSHQIQSIHASRPLFEGLVARLVKIRLGLSYVCFVHGEDINIAKTSRELTLLTQSVLRHAEKLIANSSFTRDLLLNDWNVPSDRIEMMHPGVDCEFFTPPETPHLRQLFREDQKVLLTVGRLQERKGHDTLISGLPEILRQFPDVLYAIAGDGEQRPVLQQMVSRLELEDHVRFLGEIDDSTLRQAYRECDLFALPNRTIGRDVEGFGIVLLEAQACGKPVIAGKSGGTQDTLLPERTGFLIDCQDPKNPSELVKAICKLLADDSERDRMGRNARTFVQNSFDWQSLAKKAEGILSLQW
jgi:phosphatidylinositol alpha-1,6-mannosyltransferase